MSVFSTTTAPANSHASVAGKLIRAPFGRSVLILLALVIVIAAVWAALVTLFLPPLTLGWREF